MTIKKILLSTALLGTLLISNLGTVEASSDKKLCKLTNFTVSYSDWKYHPTAVQKIKNSTTSGGNSGIINLDRENGDAWVDAVIVPNGGTKRLASVSLQRGGREPLPYTSQALAGHYYKIGVKKTYNTGNQGSASNRAVTIEAGRWSPDNY